MVKDYGKYPVSTDTGTWYPQAGKSLRLKKHHTHSSHSKSIIERTMEYVKDRTESFDDYYHPFVGRNYLDELDYCVSQGLLENCMWYSS